MNQSYLLFNFPLLAIGLAQVSASGQDLVVNGNLRDTTSTASSVRAFAFGNENKATNYFAFAVGSLVKLKMLFHLLQVVSRLHPDTILQLWVGKPSLRVIIHLQLDTIQLPVD